MKQRNIPHSDEWATPKAFYDALDEEGRGLPIVVVVWYNCAQRGSPPQLSNRARA
jgi:hypothetical protein